MKINDARKYCIYAQVYTVLLQYRGPGVLFRSPPATATLRNKKSKQNLVPVPGTETETNKCKWIFPFFLAGAAALVKNK